MAADTTCGDCAWWRRRCIWFEESFRGRWKSIATHPFWLQAVHVTRVCVYVTPDMWITQYCYTVRLDVFSGCYPVYTAPEMQDLSSWQMSVLTTPSCVVASSMVKGSVSSLLSGILGCYRETRIHLLPLKLLLSRHPLPTPSQPASNAWLKSFFGWY